MEPIFMVKIAWKYTVILVPNFNPNFWTFSSIRIFQVPSKFNHLQNSEFVANLKYVTSRADRKIPSAWSPWR
jgi:hypothetical protein